MVLEAVEREGEMMEKKRLIGMKLFPIFYILCSLIFLLLSIANTDKLAYILFALLCFVFVIGNIGILLTREWGRKLYLIFVWVYTAIVCYFWYCITRLMGSFLPDPNYPLIKEQDFWILLPIALCVLSVIYFTRPKVKEQFK